MRKLRWLFLIGLVGLAMATAGCVTMPTKEDGSLAKTNEISIGEVKVFKNPEFTSAFDNNAPQYQEMVSVYVASLKAELQKKGFTIVEGTPDYQGLVIKTKISYAKPPLGKLFSNGTVYIQVEVYQNNELVLSDMMGGWRGGKTDELVGLKAEFCIRRIVPFIVKKLSKRLL